MRETVLFLAISATFALCWRNLWQAYREGAIWYRGDKWEKKKNPILFWMTVVLCLCFGLTSPWLLLNIALGEV